LLSSLLSDMLNLCSSLNVRDHVSHPYKTRDKIILIFVVLDSRQDDKSLFAQSCT
jgi:hypothetical protein